MSPMRTRSRARIAAWSLLALAAAACSASSSPPPGANSDACTAHVDAARNKLTAVIDANSECKSDADCTSVALSAGCFDSCSRTIAAAGKSAFEAAVAGVNAAECKAYTDDRCPAPISPPCTPPTTPTCQEGKCI